MIPISPLVTMIQVNSITVTWNDHTVNGRKLNVYGKNTAYTDASDLYDSSKQGTLLGTIIMGTSTKLTVSGNYEYVGLRSDNGAMYLTEIKIDWGFGSGGGDDENHDDIVINLDLSTDSTYPNSFPTTSGTTTGSYELGGYTFGFMANTAFYFSSSYLLIGKSGKTENTTSYIELPAPVGYELSEVSITASSGTSPNVKAYVGSSYTAKVTNDWQFTVSGTSDWTVASTAPNTVYRIYLVGTGNNTYNAQITAIHLKYVYSN